MVDALQRIPRLKEIVKETGCSLDQLWEAMTRWDPDLTRRRVYYKFLLSRENKVERQQKSQSLLNLYLEHLPSGNIFYRVVYIDECRIHLGASLKPSMLSMVCK